MNNLSLVVITGLSGAGKSTAAKVLEDMGYYTIDNMPVAVLEKLVEVFFDLRIDATKVAFVIDARSKDAEGALRIIELLQKKYLAKVLFLNANETSLINRYKEHRRKHPLGDDVIDAIAKEEMFLADIKALSNIVIDTTSLNVHELSAEIHSFIRGHEPDKLSLMLSSFGFKYGLPADSDLVFDVRFMKNPHFVEGLRHKTGLEVDVAAHVFSSEISEAFINKLVDLLRFLIPQYKKEGRKFLKISIGCTGGKHRSVAVVMKLINYIKDCGVEIQIRHRDIER